MKDNEYYVIHRSVLPDYFEKVIQIKEIISSGVNISDACKQVGLSRSTFYKYKDYVNRPSTKVGKRVLLLLKLVDEPGVLSDVLNDRFYFARINDLSTLKINPKDYENDISLKGEFIRNVLASKLNEEDKNRVIEYGIKALLKEDFE